ncbi:MAG: SLC13 family permease [Alphaproteobacteria bacterium]
MSEENQKSAFFGLPVNTLMILAVSVTLLWMYHAIPVAVILTLSATVVLLIIFGERFALDLWLESRGIPGREAVVPLMAMAVALYLGAVQLETIPRVFAEKIDIIVFILSFAVIAEGIGRSGYFAFAAYKIVYKCQGNTTRLILYLFILTSILTLFTSNDIVVLVLTPIIISVCVHAGIHNTRLLLLAQFVAANTLSMGLLIGSPTNIILGKVLHIDFFQYFGLMIVPAILSCMLSMILIDWMNQNSKPGSNGLFVKRWSYTDTYRVPAFARTAHFTTRMQRWLVFFLAAVVWLAIVSALEWSLFWSAIPTAAISFFFLYKEFVEDTGNPKQSAKEVVKQIQFLPYGVLFFGMCFFIFADELSRLDFVETVVLPYVKRVMLGDLMHASISMTFLSGIVVNMLNDLPAAALLSELLKQMEVQSGALNSYMRVIVIQAFLVGLNIGCYVTPIGALAGILWFNIIKKEERAQRKLLEAHGGVKMKPLEMPTRGDMVKYGLMHFVFVGFILSCMLPFFIQLVDMLVSSPEQSEKSPLNGMISIGPYLPYIGFGLLAFTILSFRGVLRRGNVLLGHMREVFVIMTRVTIWAMKNRGLYFAVVAIMVLAGASGLLYWSEMTHDRLYGAVPGAKPLFDSVSSFMIWVMVFTGTGMAENLKPHSTLGVALVGILPLAIVGGIVLLSQLSTGKSVLKLARRLANGDIPSYRIVVINYHERFEKFIYTSLYTRDASILLLCDHSHFDQAVSFCETVNNTTHGSHRIYAAIKHPDAFHNFQEYRIEQADEIYLLSDMTTQGEYEKMRYVAKLDALLNSTRVSAVEGLDAGIAGAEHTGDDTQAEIEDLAGMPRIFIETPSERFHDLLLRSSSPLLMRSAIRMTFDSDVSAFLMADMDEGVDLISAYYRVGRPAEKPQMFLDGTTPLQKFKLNAYDLDKDGKELFRRHFSGLNIGGGPSKPVRDTRALRQLSTRVRAQVPQGTKGARYHMSKDQLKEIDYTRLMGLIMKVGPSHMHIGIPSAALSMQNIEADKIILREPFDGSKPVKLPAPKITKDEKVFVFNFTPHSRAFITELLEAFKDEKRPRIVLLSRANQMIPDEIAHHPALHILHAGQLEDMMSVLCPLNMSASTGTGKSFKPVLHVGDRVYVFLDFDQPSPESNSIDFIDRLDTQIHLMAEEAAAKHKKPALSHPDIYIAVETSGAESRVLFENFFIDKIIDTSLPRQSYLNVLSMIFHRALADRTLIGQSHGSVMNFHQAAQIASYLCRHIVAYAEDVILKDHMASELRLVGKSFSQAIMEIQAYSMPPMQLVGRVRLVSVSESTGKHHRRGFRLAEVAESEPIQVGDILLNIPML